MSGRDAGKKKPLKSPKKEGGESDDAKPKKEQDKALKDVGEKAGKKKSGKSKK